MPPRVGDGRALVGFGRWNYFTERESHIIRNRVLLDDPRKARGQISISGSDIWKVLTQPRIMQHVLLTLVSMSGFQGLTQYTPSMIKSMGFSAVRANALSSVPVYCSIVWLTILSFGAYVTTECLPCHIANIDPEIILVTVDLSSYSLSPGISFPMCACGPPRTVPPSGTDME